MSAEKCQLHKGSISRRECVFTWSLEASMTWPREFFKPPKVALALDRYLKGLEVQAGVIGRCCWCLGRPRVVGKDP